MSPKLSFATLGDHVGQETGLSDWITVDQPMIDKFADATGDHQWIHVDVERARRDSPLGTTIAHGLLSLSLTVSLGQHIGLSSLNASTVINYGYDKVRFIVPVRSGARVRLRTVLLGVEPREHGQMLAKGRATLELENSDKPALVADTLGLFIP